MLGKQDRNTSLFQCVTMEDLVPPKHTLRRLHAALDLSFVREKVATLYSRLGRRSIDPELVVRMWILQHFYGFSEREVCDEVSMHAGFRWFCGLSFNDPVPDQSTLVKLRKEKWAETDLWQALLDETVRACEAAGLVRPGARQRLGVDGTQINANAATASLEALPPAPEPPDEAPPSGHEWYLLDPPAADAAPAEAVMSPETSPPDQPSGTSEPSVAPRQGGDPDWHGERFSNTTHRSTTDPEARLYRKGNNQEAKLRYLGHYLADLRSGVILGAMATQATGTAERAAALTLLDGLAQRPGEMAADLGYRDGAFLAAVLKRGIEPLVPLGDERLEAVPEYQRRTFNLVHFRQRRSARAEAQARNATRLAARTRRGKQAQRQRTRLEHLFGEAKEHHGLGRARGRGLVRVDQQVKLTATVQNLKRLLGARRRRGAATATAAAVGAPQLRIVCGGRLRRVESPDIARRGPILGAPRGRRGAPEALWPVMAPVSRPRTRRKRKLVHKQSAKGGPWRVRHSSSRF